MTPYSRFLFWSVCTIMLILASVSAGCTTSQSTTTPTPTNPAVTSPASSGGSSAISIQNFAFIPASITIPKGTTVTWTNQDTADHQIINDAHGSVAQGALFTSNVLPKGAAYSFKFDTPGTYAYHCNIHPSMKATVIVT